jgi:hypothetical protein
MDSLPFIQPAIDLLVDLLVPRVSGIGKKETLSPEIRYEAYRRLRESTFRVLYGLDTVSQVRLTLSGALWSWTIVLPAWRSLHANLRELIVAFAEVVCVGTPAVVEAAQDVSASLQMLTGSLHSRGGPRAWLWQDPILLRGADYIDKREAVMKALRQFMIVSTEDLAKKRRASVAVPSLTAH